MAPSTSPSPSRSASSRADSRPSSLHHSHVIESDAPVPVDELVSYLLQAKRALSSMTFVLRGNQLATMAKNLHEEIVVLAAQTGFLRTSIGDQVKLLGKVYTKLLRAYGAGKKEFEAMVKALDAANGNLEQTMETLRTTGVESVFRPEGEEKKYLIDFVDEGSVEKLRNAMMESISELQSAQKAFEDDLLRFDDDICTIREAIKPPPPATNPENSTLASQTVPALLASLTQRSHEMASILTMLTTHFDLCATAVRGTEGGAALARRRAAAEASHNDGVSISGVIADTGDEDSNTPQEHAEMLRVVQQDAEQVESAVADMAAELADMEAEYEAVRAHYLHAQKTYQMVRDAFTELEAVGARLPSYAGAEAEYAERWDAEQQEIGRRLGEMDALRVFYDGYASAYDTLILEVERRRAVEAKVKMVWRKARDSVERLVEADAQEREVFRQEVGDYLPTDLWEGMTGPMKRWDLVPVQDTGDEDEDEKSGGSGSLTVDKAVVAAARERLAKVPGGR